MSKFLKIARIMKKITPLDLRDTHLLAYFLYQHLEAYHLINEQGLEEAIQKITGRDKTKDEDTTQIEEFKKELEEE